jgi:hypothetical protein
VRRGRLDPPPVDPEAERPPAGEIRPPADHGDDQRQGAEALDLVTVRLGRPTKETAPAVMRFYIGELARSPELAETVKERASHGHPGTADRRVVVKVNPALSRGIQRVLKRSGLTKSELIRGVVLLAASDCQVQVGDLPAINEKGSRTRRTILKRMAGAF